MDQNPVITSRVKINVSSIVIDFFIKGKIYGVNFIRSNQDPDFFRKSDPVFIDSRI